MNRQYTWCVLAVLVTAALWPSQAQAGGLYLTDRGSRQLARGGAFVAGANDGQSLWYNPAGLGFAGNQLHLDGTLTLFRGSFTRQSRDEVNTQNGNHPTVEVQTAPLPIPTLALSHQLGLEDWTFGLAIMAPNAIMMTWPEQVTNADGSTSPAPQRYSLISMEGSAIANLALGVAWHGVEGLSIGAGVHVIPARFRAAVMLGSCDGAICQHPEDPDWDTRGVIDLEQVITATGVLGVIYGQDKWKVGASVMLPYTIGGEAKLEVQLPNAPLFDGAEVVGDTADISLPFPLVARLGVELSPQKQWRVEVGVAFERWSTQRDLNIEPKGISIVNGVSLDEYQVGPVNIPRNMQDVWSLRLGGEYDVELGIPITVRAGVLIENGAFPDETLTALTLDSNKAVLGLGASFEVMEGLWLDLAYGHIFMQDRVVSNSVVYQQNPIRPPLTQDTPMDPVGEPEPIGNGRYEMEADFVGGGLRWSL